MLKSYYFNLQRIDHFYDNDVPTKKLFANSTDNNR